MNRIEKGQPGRGVSPAVFNNNLAHIADQLNNLINSNFYPMIGQDRFVESPLKRTDVSARGGESKVMELTGTGGIRLKCMEGADTLLIGDQKTTVAEEYNFGSRKLSFYCNNTEGVYVDYTGWN